MVSGLFMRYDLLQLRSFLWVRDVSSENQVESMGQIATRGARNVKTALQSSLSALASMRLLSLPTKSKSKTQNIGVTVADARFMKAILILILFVILLTIMVLSSQLEEGSIGGFGDHVLHFLSLDGALDDGKP